jgi:hypothetical protein
LDGQVKGKTLAEVVEEVDDGTSKEKFDRSLKQGVKLREAKFKNK